MGHICNVHGSTSNDAARGRRKAEPAQVQLGGSISIGPCNDSLFGRLSLSLVIGTVLNRTVLYTSGWYDIPPNPIHPLLWHHRPCVQISVLKNSLLWSAVFGAMEIHKISVTAMLQELLWSNFNLFQTESEGEEMRGKQKRVERPRAGCDGRGSISNGATKHLICHCSTIKKLLMP